MQLYGHSQNRYLSGALPIIERRRPEFWVAINPTAEAAQRCYDLGVKLVVRHAGPWDWDASVFNAHALVASCEQQPWWPFAYAVETPNEPPPTIGDTDWYIAEEALMAHLLAARGKKCVVGNRGTHQPMRYVPGGEIYGGRRYWWDGGPLAWAAGDLLDSFVSTCLKRNPNALLLITECGRTRALVEQTPPGQDYALGWRSPGGPTAVVYWEELVMFDALCRSTLGRHYLGSTIFQVDGDDDWASFECRGTEIAGWLAKSTGGVVGNGGGRVGEPQFVLGILTEANRLKALGINVGAPLENEVPIHATPGGEQIAAYQRTANGLFWYSAKSNTVCFLPAAGM